LAGKALGKTAAHFSYRPVKASVKDPATGKVLREIADPIGTIRVTKVDDASAEATVISGSGIPVQDAVKNWPFRDFA
jgi:hypothetical protein